MRDAVFAGAIPVFFALILIEAVVGWRRGRRLYRVNDAMACLSCGIGNLFAKLLVGGALLAVYVGVYDHVAPFHLDAGHWGTWVFGLLAVDHQYYWWHRATHRTKALWTTHVVHHQSEDYNLAVALRQSWTSPLSSLVFDLPLALLGVPPVVYLTALAIDILYQFWIHTETIGHLGPLEAVLNTPSHHRVHHAVDPRYLDRNYAGILIVWDRLYGTFAAEEHHPTYGTVTPLRSGNPVWANVEPFVALWRELADLRGGERWRALWAPPEWQPSWKGGDKVIPEPTPGRITWDPDPGPGGLAWAVGQLVVASVVTTWATYDGPTWAWSGRAVVAALVVWTLANLAGVVEGRRWVLASELGRLGALGVVVVALLGAGGPAAWGGVALAYVALSLLGLAAARGGRLSAPA